ncbi:MAG: exo-beta-N-acetylmuramidase NamZ family protein [Gemmatimonadales bacterium]
MRWHPLCLLGLLACAGSSLPAGEPSVRPGIEVLLSDSLHLIRGRRVGLLSNHTGVDRSGRRDTDLLRAAHGVRLTVLFSPEHGFRGLENRPGLPDETDSTTGLPIYSLYSGSRPPNLGGLDSLEVLLIDLQDIGARYYTYVASAVMLTREAARRGKRVVILDRPNPIGGELVQGNVREAAAPVELLVGILPVPMRHGMTLGELVRLANDVYAIGADLTVVPAAGWTRARYFDATGLPWVQPSPNMPDLESALHYPGVCLFEGTNLSVGRGTAFAYQVIGAPWLDPAVLLGQLRGAGLREALHGVDIQATEFTPIAPTDGKYDGVTLRGVRLRVANRAAYDPTRTAIALLAAIRAVHGDSLRFRDAGFDRLAAGAELRAALVTGRGPGAIWAAWEPALARFREQRAKYLLY